MLVFDQNIKIILASKSPRRQQLIRDLGFNFEIRTKEVNEDFASHLKAEEIPLFLCEKKAAAFEGEIGDNEILITADTVVWVNNKIVLNKPESEGEAFEMLCMLNGNSHMVYTGVCLKTKDRQRSFFDGTKVYFNLLSDEELWHYIHKYNPYDKAGAYGVQEWIGYVGIEKIEGDFFNVMGLPLQKLYKELKVFLRK